MFNPAKSTISPYKSTRYFWISLDVTGSILVLLKTSAISLVMLFFLILFFLRKRVLICFLHRFVFSQITNNKDAIYYFNLTEITVSKMPVSSLRVTVHFKGFKLAERASLVEITAGKSKVHRCTHYVSVYSMWHGRFN
jgi:hypothetical protein